MYYDPIEINSGGKKLVKKIYKDGTMKIEIDNEKKTKNGISYNVKSGIPIGSFNELVSLNSKGKDSQGKEYKEKMISLGEVDRKYVVTPDLGNI